MIPRKSNGRASALLHDGLRPLPRLFFRWADGCLTLIVKSDPTTTVMPTLSKSKLIAYRQCPKRLWLWQFLSGRNEPAFQDHD
jgi:hypothetical protein